MGLYTRTEDVLQVAERRGGNAFVYVHDRTHRPLCGCGKTNYDFRRSPFCRTRSIYQWQNCNLTQPDFHCDGHFPFNRFSWKARELYAMAFLAALARSDGITFDEMRCAIEAFKPTLVIDSHRLIEPLIARGRFVEAAGTEPRRMKHKPKEQP
jgi:hypothetical protein